MEKLMYYGLFKKASVDEDGKISDESRLTYHQDINEIYWFRGKYGYVGEDYFICELEEDEQGDLVQVEGSEKWYN